jgi:hypothetical protein
MQSALQIKTKVLPGNKIKIQIPEAAIGDTVDVFVRYHLTHSRMTSG